MNLLQKFWNRNRDYGLPSSKTDIELADHCISTPQTEHPAYRLAFHDEDFLTREELRPVRLQLELLKPELELSDQKIDSTIVVFGSARLPAPEDDPQEEADPAPGNVLNKRRAYDEARRFAELVTRQGQCDESERKELVVVTGGGPGIMEAANRGADDAGGKSIGLNIVLEFEQAPNPYITPELCFQFHYFAIRKMHFLMRARALVCFPGGYGTFDELFEALCLIQTKKMKRVPILLFDKAFWTRVVNFEALADEGVISRKDLDLFTFVESAEEAWDILNNQIGCEGDPA